MSGLQHMSTRGWMSLAASGGGRRGGRLDSVARTSNIFIYSVENSIGRPTKESPLGFVRTEWTISTVQRGNGDTNGLDDREAESQNKKKKGRALLCQLW